MNYKVWLIFFGSVSFALLAGAGFYAYSSYSKYTKSLETWDLRVGSVESLERRKPYPSKDNTEAFRKEVESYQSSVDLLFEKLTTTQRPLNKSLTATEFVQLVKNRIQEFRAYALEGDLELENPGQFQLGFNAYSNLIPPQELVPYLDYELEAINHLVRILVDSNADQLVTFSRDPILNEASGEDLEIGSDVHKYPVRLRFRSDHEAFQSVINALANDKEFFYIIRVLKVKNDTLEGPSKLSTSGAGDSLPTFTNPETQEVAGIDLLQQWGFGSISALELEAAARAEGFLRSDQDAEVLMGQELLTVYMVVDIVRFVEPEEVKVEEESDES